MASCKITRTNGVVTSVLADNGKESNLYKSISQVPYLSAEQALVYYQASIDKNETASYLSDENGEPIVVFASRTPNNNLLLSDAIVHTTSIDQAIKEDFQNKGVEMSLVKKNNKGIQIESTGNIVKDIANSFTKGVNQLVAQARDGIYYIVNRKSFDVVELANFAPNNNVKNLNGLLNDFVNEGLIEGKKTPLSELMDKLITDISAAIYENGNKQLEKLEDGKIELQSAARLYQTSESSLPDSRTSTTIKKEAADQVPEGDLLGKYDIPEGTTVEYINIQETEINQEEDATVNFDIQESPGRVAIVASIDQNRIGSLRLVETENGFQVDTISVSPEYRRNGIGTEMYRVAAESLDGEIVSDTAQTIEAMRLWENLVSMGEAEQIGAGRFRLVKPETGAGEVSLVELSDEELAKNSFTTQRANTLATYRKAAKMLGDGTVLDYGAGLGLGTDAMRDEFGKDVESFEPNTELWEGKTPPTYTKSQDINKRYDSIVSLNVLNVVPKNVRDFIVRDILNKLQVGGKAYVSARGWKGDIASSKSYQDFEKTEKKSLLAKASRKDKVTGEPIFSFQKGFDGNELLEYIQEILGDAAVVEKPKQADKLSKTSVVITKVSELPSIDTETAEETGTINEGQQILQDEVIVGETQRSIKVITKDNLKALEKNAVQDSDAQIVKLTTKEGGKKKDVFIVKDQNISLSPIVERRDTQNVNNLDYQISRLIQQNKIEGNCKL